MIVTSLQECCNNSNKFTKIYIVNSYGIDFLLFHYKSLGLGNLITAYAGAVAISNSSEKKEIIGVPKIRLRPFSLNIMSWYARSEIGINNVSFFYNRIKYKNNNINKDVSYIDIDKKILYLSTNLVNIDKKYIDLFMKNINHADELYREFGLSLNNNKLNKDIKVGLHIRRGDFKINADMKIYIPNAAPPIEYYLLALEKIGLRQKIIVTIYSDQSNKITREILEEFPNQSIIYKIFSPWKNATQVLNSMMEQDILVHSNSTLSTWSSILSRQSAIYPYTDTPYSSHRSNKNFISINSI